MADRLGILVGRANDGVPIRLQTCPDSSAVYIGKRLGTASDGKPIYGVVGCDSSEIRLARLVGRANDGKPIFVAEKPCCGSPGPCVASGPENHPCCSGVAGAISLTSTWHMLLEWVSGPDTVLDGYTETLTYQFSVPLSRFVWTGFHAASGAIPGGNSYIMQSATSCGSSANFIYSGGYTWNDGTTKNIQTPTPIETEATIPKGTFCVGPCSFLFMNVRFVRTGASDSRYNVHFSL